MKSFILLAATAIFSMTILSCNRASVSQPGTDATMVTVPNTSVTHSNLRLAGSDYSQPISIETGNKMISSYLQSVNYPYQDSAIRSLSFDADTLRAYLSNPSITTMKFYFAHQMTYIADGSNFGKYSGMRPGTLTIIAVGVNDAGAVVRNSTNGVYEHALPCPNNCGLDVDAFLH